MNRSAGFVWSLRNLQSELQVRAYEESLTGQRKGCEFWGAPLHLVLCAPVGPCLTEATWLSGGPGEGIPSKVDVKHFVTCGGMFFFWGGGVDPATNWSFELNALKHV